VCADAKEVHMYLHANDIDALLVMSISEHIVQYRLKRSTDGRFEVLELLSEPRLEITKDKDESEEEGLKDLFENCTTLD
jgi:hypothetical protein